MKFVRINRGHFLGFADLYLPECGIEIKGCTLYENNGARWVNLPSKEYVDEHNERKYAYVIRYRNDEKYKEFCRLAKEAIDKYK